MLRCKFDSVLYLTSVTPLIEAVEEAAMVAESVAEASQIAGELEIAAMAIRKAIYTRRITAKQEDRHDAE